MPQYTYRTYDLTSNGDHYWIAESLQLKGCIGEGNTERDAIKELAKNVSIHRPPNKQPDTRGIASQ